MEEENKEEKKPTEQKSDKPSFKTADELTQYLMDMQGQIENMQQTIDKLSPVEQNADDKKDDKEDDEPSEKEVSEIDALLQSE